MRFSVHVRVDQTNLTRKLNLNFLIPAQGTTMVRTGSQPRNPMFNELGFPERKNFSSMRVTNKGSSSPARSYTTKATSRQVSMDPNLHRTNVNLLQELERSQKYPSAPQTPSDCTKIHAFAPSPTLHEHRAHSSTEGLPAILQSGLLLSPSTRDFNLPPIWIHWC